jgi:SAM-dependent methyltransferase
LPPRNLRTPLPEKDAHAEILATEFERAAQTFGERTRGRFDDMDVVAFSRARPHDTVVEVGAGTGNFLSLFSGVCDRLVAVDVTLAMLRQARSRHPELFLVAGDGLNLPLATGGAQLVATAQVLHHVPRPVPFLAELRRVVAPDGRVLVVDQIAPERFEQASAMNELEVLRDPSHAASRPPSAFRVMLGAVGLAIVDEREVASVERLSGWMWSGEFPQKRIEAVRAFIERRGVETGMGFERDGDDWVFERRRIMLLAERSGP